jgi:glycosyltransferase involved in cell wall biosynthesis
MSDSSAVPGLPRVSVIMPVRNEAAFIASSLGAVLAQDYPAARLEVLVADGASTDDTRAIVERMAAAQAVPVRIIENPAGTAAAGLNRAMAEAGGAVVIRVDGHCVIPPHYVRRCVHLLAKWRADGVGGPVRTIGETPAARAIAAAMSSRFGVGDSAFRTTRGVSRLVDTVPFPAYTREAIERAGPYDEELVRNQDDEYNYRLRGLGCRILLAGDLESAYYGRATFGRLWRQYFEYGCYKVRVMQKHPLQMRPRQFAPAAFVLALGAGVPLALLGMPMLIAAAGGSYLLALATATIARARADRELLVRLPAAFAVLHVAYGTGFLAGLVRFRNHWGRSRTPAALAGDKPRPSLP